MNLLWRDKHLAIILIVMLFFLTGILTIETASVEAVGMTTYTSGESDSTIGGVLGKEQEKNAGEEDEKLQDNSNGEESAGDKWEDDENSPDNSEKDESPDPDNPDSPDENGEKPEDESPEEQQPSTDPEEEESAEAYPRVEEFVTRFYRLCLDRIPEGPGLDYWIEELISGNITGAEAARGFIFSTEFTEKNVSDQEFIEVMYSAFFDRDPDEEGQEHWLERLSSGYGRLYVLAGFVNSQEYEDLCESFGIVPGTIIIDAVDASPLVSDFVTRFYRLCLDREPESEGLNTWVENLTSGKITGAQAAQGFIFSPEFTGREVSDQEFIEVMYLAFFDRDPEEEGQEFWLEGLEGDLSRLQVLAGFVNSQEYEDLCERFGITPGTIVVQDKGLVTFVLDDGTLNQYQRLFPLFQSRGIPAVWSIPTSLINTGSFQGYPLASWAQIDHVANNSNWEINSHSHTHSMEMIYLPDGVLTHELAESRRLLEKYGVHSFTYPYYTADHRVAQRVSQYYEAAYAGAVSRNNLGGMYGAADLNNINYADYINANRYRLKRVTLTGMSGALLSDVNENNWKALIDTAYQNDGWLVFCVHNVNDISQAELEKIIDYTFQVGIPVGVTRDGLSKYVSGYSG